MQTYFVFEKLTLEIKNSLFKRSNSFLQYGYVGMWVMILQSKYGDSGNSAPQIYCSFELKFGLM